jgi:hypothetical protein
MNYLKISSNKNTKKILNEFSFVNPESCGPDPDPTFQVLPDPGGQTNVDPGGSGSWSGFAVTKV